MLNPAIAQTVIDHALSLGADFVELYVERQLRSTLNTLSDRVDSVQSGWSVFVVVCLLEWLLAG